MKLGSLSNPRFSIAFDKLMKLPGVPGKGAFKLRTIAKKVTEEIAKYEEAKKSYINEYAEKDPRNGNVLTEITNGQEFLKFAPGVKEQYVKKIAELNDVDVEIPTISWPELGDNPNLTPEELFYLEFLVE